MQGRMTRTSRMVGVLAAVTAIAAPAAAQACERDGAMPAALTANEAREAVICLINERRAQNGVGALSEESRLQRAAQVHSKAMDAANFFSHSGRGGSSPQSRIQRAGYMAGASAWGVAENIRWGRALRGTPKATVAAWMNSPSHRAALLNGSYRHVGVGFALGSPTGRGERKAAVYTATFGYRG